MKKRLIPLIVAVVMLFSMLCPAAYADDETVSFDTCTHEWETPLLLLFPVRMFHLALKLNSVKSANGISTLQQFLLRSLLTIHH